jgi:putative N6-adenine-specific DNA methylase
VTRHHCLAVCAPGLEALTGDELTALGVRLRRTLLGGVEFSANDRQLYAANLWLRTATRLLVRVGTGLTAHTFDELERQVGDLDWAPWLAAGTRPQLRVSSLASHLYHTGAVAERLEELLATGDAPGPMVVVRIIHDRVMVSVDSSGDPLYRRGWRLDQGEAPLRETLAAALVIASGWDRRSPLVDPLCGSGTIAIEAALLAADLPPGGGRRFAFEQWPSFQPGTWASVAGEARARSASAPVVARRMVRATDRDAAAVRAATANAQRAGVAGWLELGQSSLSELTAPRGGPGWLVTNPPYGKRVGGGDLRNLYANLGAVVRDRLDGWHVGLLVADVVAAGHSGLALHERLHTANGGIPVSFLVTDESGPTG